MARRATGTVYAQGGIHYVRVTLGRARPTFAMPACRELEEAQARGAVVADAARRLRASGHETVADGLLTRLAAAPTERARDTMLVAIDRVIAGAATAIATAKPVTFREFAEDWTEGRLHERWPDHVKKKASSSDDRERAALHIYPIVGDVLLTDFGLDEADAVMNSLASTLSPASRRHIAQIIRRVLQMAVYPARLIPTNPLPRGFLPTTGSTKAMTYLYPAEDAALLGCRTVPLAHRVLYGFLAREGMRRSEAERLTWGDVDLERGVVTLDQTKTDDARAWALDPRVASALARWHVLQGSPGGAERVFGVGLCRIAAELRTHLTAAGVERKALFERTANRQPIRVHDLRATFITVSLAVGKSETWVMDRTGHTTSAMVNRYRRAARSLAEIGAGSLMPLDEAIPELRIPPGEVGPGGQSSGISSAAGQSGSGVAHVESANPANLKPSARGRGRTGTPLLIADFESESSASDGRKPQDCGAFADPDRASREGSDDSMTIRREVIAALSGLIELAADDESMSSVLRSARDLIAGE